MESTGLLMESMWFRLGTTPLLKSGMRSLESVLTTYSGRSSKVLYVLWSSDGGQTITLGSQQKGIEIWQAPAYRKIALIVLSWTY